jgi:hypothetical protein
MWRLSYRSNDVVVYDDVLAADEFRHLFSYLNSLDYQSVHVLGWRKVWRLHDGNPLTSRAGWHYNDGNGGKPEELVFPTETPVDTLVRWIIERTPEIESIVGKSGTNWRRFSFAPWVYPPGSGLSLHQDGHIYSGAFTYFAHPDWHLHWGGHLMVLDEPKGSAVQASDVIFPPFLTDDPSEITFDPGFAFTVFAKPNRIAFLSPTCRHVMTRVDSNAGQNARVSVAGFFHDT